MRTPIYPNVEAFIKSKKHQKYNKQQEEMETQSNEQPMKKRGNVNY